MNYLENPDVERASIAESSTASLRHRLRHAPPEVRKAIDRDRVATGLPRLWPAADARTLPGSHVSPSKQTPAKSPARGSKRYVGWCAGVVSPGLSVPSPSKFDGRVLREQFTDRCWQSMLSQLRKMRSEVTLQWGHGGYVLARGLDLTFRSHPHFLMGICFEARLLKSRLGELVLDMMQEGGLGVSIAYSHAQQHHVERDGTPVRVIDDCRVHHVALLRPEDGHPAFRGARAFGKRSTSLGCSEELRFQAEQFAWAEIKRQFGGAK